MTNTVVIGLQWGDEGKGKIVDYLSVNYDAVVRFQGGSNAGHTVRVGGLKYVFHLLPSGLLRGKRLFIGPGVVVDPVILGEELEKAKMFRQDVNLKVDYRCTVVSPIDRWLDAHLERLRGAAAIGTTKRGIGPAYAGRMLRIAPTVADVLEGGKEIFELTEKLFGHSSPELEDWLVSAKETLTPVTGDVGLELQRVMETGGSILFEGAQGALLDILYGTYPHVTSCHTLAPYATLGAGIPPGIIDEVIGVMKAYQTRVGGGPFPTEITGEKGNMLRTKGGEYGATTGRPRRVGWLDLAAARHAVRLNGVKKIALTKVDVLGGLKELKVAVAYDIDGQEVRHIPANPYRLKKAKPIYVDLDPIPKMSKEGWARIAKMGWDALPPSVKKFVEFLEQELRVEIVMLSVGEERGMTVERK